MENESAAFINYSAIFIYLIFAAVVTVVVVFANKLLGPSLPSARKGTAYESGIVPTGDARERFRIRYHVNRHDLSDFRLGNCLYLPLGCNVSTAGVGRFY